MGITQEKSQNKTMIIIVDSDGLIGSLLPSDHHYEASQKISAYFQNEDVTLIYPATVLVETITLLQARLNQPRIAREILRLIIDNQITIEPIDNCILQQAATLMDIKNSKHHTLFDCIVAALAQKHDATGIFSFDKFYKKLGFKLASEL